MLTAKPDGFVHPYLGLTPADRKDMLEHIGLESADQLFEDIPKAARVSDFSGIGAGLPEQSVYSEMLGLSNMNATAMNSHFFFPGSLRFHYVPAAVQKIVDRGEFLTAYTPYQPEVSQGLLQALFEYQSMVSELVGLEAVNSSHYSYGTCLGEASHMANRINGRSKVVVCGAIDPERLAVLETYCYGKGMTVLNSGYDSSLGEIDVSNTVSMIDGDTSLVYAESPNRFGIIEPRLYEVAEESHRRGAIFCQGFDLVSLSLFASPADNGADIAVGEGVGFPPSYGGPGLGIFATAESLVRKAPGRLVGATVDRDGRRGFVITLQTREQHIRRGKATSNITTNSAILAVANAAYLALLGDSGLERVARTVLAKTVSVTQRLEQTRLASGDAFKGYAYQDKVFKMRVDFERLRSSMREHGVFGPVPLGDGLPNYVLLGVSETTSEEDIRQLVLALENSV